MYLNHTKVLTSISLLSLAIMTSLLPAMMTLSIIAVSATSIGVYYLAQNYDIDYKYWFSFIGQLLGLVIFITTFISMFLLIIGVYFV